MVVGINSKIHGERKISADDDSQTAGDGLLIAKARGNPAAFAQLYRRHYDAVFRYCVHRLFDRQAAEDVTSAVFLKVVENFGRFKGDGQRDFRNWLYTIATNTVNSHLRKTARRDSLLKANCWQSDSVELTDEATEKFVLLRRAMLTLRPRYQTIIALRFFENLKLTEIAELLDSRPATIRSQLARALAVLRKKMPLD